MRGLLRFRGEDREGESPCFGQNAGRNSGHAGSVALPPGAASCVDTPVSAKRLPEAVRSCVVPKSAFAAPAWWTSQNVGRLLGPPEFVIPVVGAGISRGAGLPDSSQLADWLRQRVPFLSAPAEEASLFAVVDAIDQSKMSSFELQTLVADHIARLDLRPSPFVSQLVNLPSRVLITLNYDDSLGAAAEQHGLAPRRLSLLDELERDEAHRLLTAKEWPPSELTIVHLHGHA